jgi:hypothetical protein
MLLRTSTTSDARLFPDRYRQIWTKGVKSMNGGVVAAYKVAGFVLLGVILFGMFAYLATSGFYLLSDRWMLPSVLTPGNDKVVQAQLAWLDQVYQLEKLQAELTTFRKEQETANGAATLQREFEKLYATALINEASRSKSRLRATEAMLEQMGLGTAGGAVAGGSAVKTVDPDWQLAQHLITQEEYLRLKDAQVAQQERAVAMQERADGLRGLAAVSGLPGAAPDVDALLKRRPLIDAKIRLAELEAEDATLGTRIAALEELVTRYRATVDTMRLNPYVRAATGKLNVAFVPYDHLTDEGAAGEVGVYGCYLEFVFCSRAGKVKQILEGEIVGKHPVTGREVRGRLVELDLKDDLWAKSRSLMLRRPPLGV